MYDEGRPGAAVPLGQKFGHFGNSYPAHLDDSSFLGFSRHVRQSLAVLDNGKSCFLHGGKKFTICILILLYSSVWW